MTTAISVAPIPAWGEYAIQDSQHFTPIASKNISYGIIGLTTVASNSAGDAVLVLNPQLGTVTIQRTGRFMICGSTYVAGAVQAADPNATIDIMGAISIQLPAHPAPNPGVGSHVLRLGQAVVRLSPTGQLPYSGFSFSTGTALLLPSGTTVSLRVGVFADNLSKGQFLDWQTRPDSAANGANLTIHEIPDQV